ncbi:MAG: PAS domain-containing protein [Myxococcales bacterium]|nr:PAS domain-containing protein [Myxococcales bacterium]MCB9581897.1 PAS domain-containing protein [Polyangiaceae bacterium]
MKLGIRTKLFLISLGLIVLTVVVSYAYARSTVDKALTEQVRRDLAVRATLVAHDAQKLRAPLDDRAKWDAFAGEVGQRAGARVTMIRNDGVVIGDSEVPTEQLAGLENHRNRPEVRRALAGETGEDSRMSETVGHRLMYVAVPFEHDGTVVGVARVALPLTMVDVALSGLTNVLSIATLIALAVAIVMSTVAAQLASRTARSLTDAARRMAGGDLSVRTKQKGHDEFGELGRALDRLAESLSTTLEELRSERDRAAGILSGMQEGLLMLGRDGRVALVNPALREMLLLGADAVGKTPLEVIRHADLKELLDGALTSEESGSVEIEVGGLRPRRLMVRATPLAGKEGGVFAVFVDVTEMRRLETLRRDFVANVSHELRTPVTAIRSAAETLEAAVDRDPVASRRFVDIIDRNATRLHELVEDLLDLSRIESRQYKLNAEPMDIEPVLSHVLGLFRERADRGGVELLVEASDDLPLVSADRRAIEQVLSNLVDNAVKYSTKGCQVTLSAKLSDGKVEVSVADTGTGIEERHLPRLFERFYRVDAGRSRELGGTGLGLSIVKHLLDSMGSRIDVESTLGKGTTFRFTLRVVDVDAPLTAAAEVRPVLH